MAAAAASVDVSSRKHDVSSRSLANAEFQRKVLQYKSLSREQRRSLSAPLMLPPHSANPEQDASVGASVSNCPANERKMIPRKLDSSVGCIKERVWEESSEDGQGLRFYLGYVPPAHSLETF